MDFDDTRILIVDDSTLDQRLLSEYLGRRGYKIECASDGLEALEKLQADALRYDLVLLDRQMPRMGGMEVLANIKRDPRLRTLPVILQTAAASRQEIMEGFAAGAYYYLPKPYDVDVLMTVVASAARDFGEYKRLQEQLARGLQCLTLIRSAVISIRTVEEARNVASVVANACPSPYTAVIGLTELLVNGVEHGNLGITYEDKTALNADGSWEEEVNRRLALPENAGKRVELRLDRKADELRFTIRDEGPGFLWNGYLTVDPKRAFDNHGRGIAIARSMSFDSVEYRGTGNEVVATVKLAGG